MPGIKEINIKKISFIMFLVTLSMSCQKHNTSLKKITSLKKSLKEVSGITQLSDGNLYAINDSGNDNTLFCLDSKGDILEKIKIPGAKNIDWEDLAYGENDTLYIGDFGNNTNDRKNLVIYKVSGVISRNISVSKIKFTLGDQKSFPPKKKNLNFDVEAFIYLNDHLYLFSKNRSSKFEGTTKLYQLSTKPGKHVAKLIDTYSFCNDPADCFITGAAINTQKDKIVLLTYNKLFILSDFKNNNLFKGGIQKIKLKHYSQKEGICFKNDTTLFITDESGKKKKASLYEYTLD
ncbi:SdiA-regulated domain-containing protein [Aquimarina algicola]|uniref:Uncharacterized protein n=1 Tax=Aquimarina algicola TaxID=2589995 RepID=A0A504J5T7_9FLAO|nr:SdiA-regulated domain-containing protein [Aquimarina algicola]TPN82449.1 hypothetical protein FHK87_23810 [Aquimarina algicola]